MRGEDSKRKAKYSLTIADFSKQIKMLHQYAIADYHNDNVLVKYSAMCLWQYLLIGRVDDTVNFGMASPKGHDIFDFGMKTKVQWSKTHGRHTELPRSNYLRCRIWVSIDCVYII